MAEEGQVISVHTLESWKEQLQRAKDSNKLVVVDFAASWCAPCRFIAPILAEIAKLKPEVIFLKVDVDELRSVVKEWFIESIPTFLFLKDEKLVDKVVGAKKEAQKVTIEKHSSAIDC
ncbi:hypothetical protein Fmac_032678 [Flemingia macrophylla]|uniref:Thioredoxin domain-containing protein n=1 Tax=Flemingia macrophylla TaxID=520843 RepID=A0ABD1L5K5_9FABA